MLEQNLSLIQVQISRQIKIQKSYFTSEVFPTSRKARGILLIGRALHFCCSVVHDEMFERSLKQQQNLNSHLNSVLDLARQNDNNSRILQEHLQSFAQETRYVTDKIQENLQILAAEIIQLTKNPDISQHMLLNLLNLWTATFQNFKYDNLRHVRAECNLKKLTKSLIPEKLLRNDLNIVQNQLIKDGHSLAMNLKDEIHLFYELPLTTCFWSETELIIKLQ